jgi:DNA-binding beta-propeller fold protein YncE
MVVAADTGKTLADIPDTPGVHGVALVPDLGRAFTTNGRDATMTIFDLTSYKTLGKVKAADDADAVVFDPASRRVLAFCGDAGVMAAFAADVDPAGGKADAVVPLGGKPESGAVDGRGGAWVNLVDKDQIAVIDTRGLKVTAHWPTAPGKQPVAMAIDAKSRRLFVGCRNGLLLVLDADTGKSVGQFKIGQNVDAAVFDEALGLAMVSCGDGTLAVLKEESAETFTLLPPVKTAPGARTVGLDPRTHTLYLPAAGKTATNPQGKFRILVVAGEGAK